MWSICCNAKSFESNSLSLPGFTLTSRVSVPELDLRIHPPSRVRGPRQSTCLPFPTAITPANWSSQISEESLSTTRMPKATGLSTLWATCVPEQHPQMQLLPLLPSEPESVPVRTSQEPTWSVAFLIAVTKAARRRESLFLDHSWRVLHHEGEDTTAGAEAVVTAPTVYKERDERWYSAHFLIYSFFSVQGPHP